MTRNNQIERFLSRTNWSQANRSALSQDASFRRYWRLEQNTKLALLMDAPPPEKSVSVFADIAVFLRQQGIYAPQIYAQNEVDGLMLIEDFGEDTFTRILTTDPTSEIALYDLAIDTLCELHQIEAEQTLRLGNYDIDTLLGEAGLFCEWFFPAISGSQITLQARQSFDLAWRQSIETLSPLRSVLVLRDYHVDNLMRLHTDDGQTLCGVLDFQDALYGSPAYDLMSLLEDARRDISPGLHIHCLKRYFRTMAGADPGFPEADAFQPWLNVLAAQRHAKVLGIFIRLYQRDKKPHYLKHLPHVLRLFQAAIEREPGLAPIAHWMQVNLPFSSISLSDARTE